MKPCDAWTYHAKDSATGAVVAVHLTREACTDATNDTLDSCAAALGKILLPRLCRSRANRLLKGLRRIAAELFPKINNQPDEEDDAAKKKATRSNRHQLQAPRRRRLPEFSGQRLYSAAARRRRSQAPAGTELALSHDGKKLLYTRSDQRAAPSTPSFSTILTPANRWIGARSRAASLLVAR